MNIKTQIRFSACFAQFYMYNSIEKHITYDELMKICPLKVLPSNKPLSLSLSLSFLPSYSQCFLNINSSLRLKNL